MASGQDTVASLQKRVAELEAQLAASSPKSPQKGAKRGLSGLVLSADCGGTNTRISMYQVDPDDEIVEKTEAPGKRICQEKYANKNFNSLEDILSSFLRQYCSGSNPKPSVAVLAVAGIVTNNACRYTNLDWVVDGNAYARDLGIERVEVINDFVAQGYGMLTLEGSETVKLNENASEKKGAPICCIGAGTGLGTCFLVADPSGQYLCYPSEGGHVEFPPRGEGNDEQQMELLKYLKVKFSGWNRVSVERVVSGSGICNIYEFLTFSEPKRVDKAVHREYLKGRGDAGVIAKHAKEGNVCQEALDIFASCYGAACGSMAISFMPFRGLYLTGGVTKRMSEQLFSDPHGPFLSAYYDKGRVSPILEQVPLYLVKNDDMGQRGAHLRAVIIFKEHMAGLGPRVECSGSVDTNLLVAPRALVYSGEPDKLITKSEESSPANLSTNRKQRLQSDEAVNEALFKTMLWRLVQGGSPKNADDWNFRLMWISKNGDFCTKSNESGESLISWTAEDLAKASLDRVSDAESCREFTFRIKLGEEVSYFSAFSAASLELWLGQLVPLFGTGSGFGA